MEIDLLQEEIDSLENEIALLTRNRKPYRIQVRRDPFTEYTDHEFRRRFRLTKDTVQYLYSLIGAELEPLKICPGFTISAMEKILVTLRYYATDSFHLVTADFHGVSESSICNIVPVVSNKIASLRSRFITMPFTDNEIEEKKREFFNVARMPATIGAVDGTLIKIQEVGRLRNKTMFFCRKQYYAINVQIICDPAARVLDIVAQWPGCIHDQTVLLRSKIYAHFASGEFVRQQRHSLLLGDGGYRAEEFLAVPLRATNPQSRLSEQMYQRAHISSRNVVERFMGQWKKRFPCLWIGMCFRKLAIVQDVIVATAVLHNFCKEQGDTQQPTLSAYEQQLYNAAIAQEREFRNSQRATRREPNTISNAMLKRYFENLANERHQQ